MVYDGEKIVSLVIGANICMFILSLLIDLRPNSLNFSPLQFLSPSNQSLLVLGSTGTVPVFQFHRWWSLLAANFLHGGLLHILFNMLALRQLAPMAVEVYGASRMFLVFTIGGIAGFMVSTLAGVQFTIGASAAVCSLIGSLLYYGKSRGGVYGQAIFSQLGGWALGIALFGFMVPGINNWGHGGGMAAGALFGFLLGYKERRRETFGHRIGAIACLGACGLVLLWSIFNGALYLLVR